MAGMTTTLVGQLRVLGFLFTSDDDAAAFSHDCRERGLRTWAQRDTVAVVVDDAAVEAEVRVAAIEAGGTRAG